MTHNDDILIDEVSGVEERPQNRREWSGVVRSLVLPALIVATIVGVLLYIERARGSGSGDDGAYGIVALPSALATDGRIGTELGNTAPDFLLRRPEGGELRLSDLRGKPVMVNFWATWCTPCRKEMPEIVKAYNERNGALAVVGVNLQENSDQITAWAADFGIKFDIVVDRTGQVSGAWRVGGPVLGLPSTYFLDKDGIVRARVFGPMDEARLNENLATILP